MASRPDLCDRTHMPELTCAPARALRHNHQAPFLSFHLAVEGELSLTGTSLDLVTRYHQPAELYQEHVEPDHGIGLPLCSTVLAVKRTALKVVTKWHQGATRTIANRQELSRTAMAARGDSTPIIQGRQGAPVTRALVQFSTQRRWSSSALIPLRHKRPPTPARAHAAAFPSISRYAPLVHSLLFAVAAVQEGSATQGLVNIERAGLKLGRRIR